MSAAKWLGTEDCAQKVTFLYSSPLSLVWLSQVSTQKETRRFLKAVILIMDYIFMRCLINWLSWLWNHQLLTGPSHWLWPQHPGAILYPSCLTLMGRWGVLLLLPSPLPPSSRTINTRSSQIDPSGDSDLIMSVPEQAVATVTATGDHHYTAAFPPGTWITRQANIQTQILQSS